MTEITPLVIVTGANGGIGAATADLFARHGYTVIAHGSPASHERRTTRSAEYSRNGREYIPMSSDLSTPAGVESFTAEVAALLGSRHELKLKTLVNCAALLAGPGFGTTDAAAFDAYFAVNARAPFLLTQTLTEHMEAGASIVNVSSAGVHFSSPDDVVYAMTKAAVESMTRHIAEPLARSGIRVNAVIPGFTRNNLPVFQSPAFMNYLSQYALLGGVAEPDDVAEAILFLASDASKRTTGTTLDVTGGSLLAHHDIPGPAFPERVAAAFAEVMAPTSTD